VGKRITEPCPRDDIGRMPGLLRFRLAGLSTPAHSSPGVHCCRYNQHLICGGAFVGLEKVIGRRVGKKALGFRALSDPDAKEGDVTTIRAQRESELLRQAEPQDLLTYGLIPEFVGRLPSYGVP